MSSVREFAERVLMSNSLEEKLAHAPAGLELDAPMRGGYVAPDLPGRPADLIPYQRQDKTSFPSAEQLEDEEQRAVLLHFFANHELLAVELMALALLKFPDAPDSFRRGVFHTLREEQNHTRWYVQRMKECGIGFGDLPVSPMIWGHISEMESPLDYVSRLSLTFEQANLDYAKHYAGVLGAVGDKKTAKILEKVYHDEIAHVGHGVKWLRRWKEKAQSDWDAWRGKLILPMSPMRAKGMAPFNEEGRRKAGLNEEFIASLKRYHSSRGRSPDLWYFNPDVEAAAEKPGWTCPQRLEELAADLEGAFALAGPTQDDLVMMRRMPSDGYRDQVARYGLVFPEVIEFQEVGEVEKKRKLRSVRPWGEVGELLSKEATLKLRSLLPEAMNPLPARVCEAGEVDEFVGGYDFEKWVGKALYGAAGRGMVRFEKGGEIGKFRKAMVVEPWVEKTCEFSLLFHRSPEAQGGLRFIGTVHQETTEDGQWVSSESRAKPASGLSEAHAKQLNQEVFPAVERELIPALETLLGEARYFGPVCLDSFFYGEGGWQPVVELNARWTMGRLAHQLRLKLAANGSAKLTTYAVEDAKEVTSPEKRGAFFRNGVVVLGDPESSVSRVPVVELT